MELKDQFEKAVTESRQLAKKPANEALLQLYALFKQATEGDIQSDPPANLFDFVAKAKYDAWIQKKGMAKEAAMEAYIKLVNSLKS